MRSLLAVVIVAATLTGCQTAEEAVGPTNALPRVMQARPLPVMGQSDWRDLELANRWTYSIIDVGSEAEVRRLDSLLKSAGCRGHRIHLGTAIPAWAEGSWEDADGLASDLDAGSTWLRFVPDEQARSLAAALHECSHHRMNQAFRDGVSPAEDMSHAEVQQNLSEVLANGSFPGVDPVEAITECMALELGADPTEDVYIDEPSQCVGAADAIAGLLVGVSPIKILNARQES